MRIQTRLFVIIASLVLALVGVQWWLQVRQLHALETELAHVAATVSEDLVFTVAVPRAFSAWMDASPFLTGKPEPPAAPPAPTPPPPPTRPAPAPGRGEDHERVDGRSARREGERQRVIVRRVLDPSAIEEMARGQEMLTRVEEEVLRRAEESMKRREEFVRRRDSAIKLDQETRQRAMEEARRAVAQAAAALRAEPMEIRVEARPEGRDTELVLSGIPGGDRRITLPGGRTEEIVRTTLRQGLLASAVLLGLGLLGAAVIAHNVGRPLRNLAGAADRLGRGELGTTTPVTARGEVGELQQAFNRMSVQLAALETERAAWQEREHLAQLGDLARGLGHTLRNPLNTLGLAVEELAEQAPDEGRELAATARGQIRRIDRWLRSFLALGAGDAAQREEVDLAEVVRAVAFEATQQGCSVAVAAGDEPVTVCGVPGALRAALANLVENACQASPAGESVQVRVEAREAEAVVTIRDHGPGLPEEVRARLFEPHVTTRPGGSGMGLFLAHQLLERTHGGRLQIGDAEGGGTEVVISLPAAAGAAEADGA